jgi:hypothetical protein
MRSTAITLSILAATALAPTGAGAGPIVYHVVDYPALQDGYTIAGTITTNGDIGTGLPAGDITSWDITITSGSYTIFHYTPVTTLNLGTGFDATPTAIIIEPAPRTNGLDFSDELFNHFIFWDSTGTSTRYYAESGDVLWLSTFGDVAVVVAVVAEPSSAVLAAIGAAGVVAGLVRRRRAQPPPR